MNISKEILDEVALSEKEYKLIVQQLGREPSEVELGMFGSLWSEHCGYKHSKPLLKLLPSRSKNVLVSPGEENAGVVDIGDGQAVVMKIESHNHPSAIDPYQGAATAAGGVIRDIFTMGARPIALLNSLRFGPLTESNNCYLFNGVVGGLADYGNCLGIPGVGGEVFFADRYTGNPLVNGLCLGICEKDKLVKARASGEGNLLLLVGADTGRDGIHGASGLASRSFGDEPEAKSMIPAGNPSLEKLLIEACLELAQTDWIVGMQDLGAAGLTSATVETAARGGGGVEIDVSKVSRREEGMTPYEVMLSESQERMLVIVKKGCEEEVKALLDRWEIHSDIIGRVTNTDLAVVKEGEKVVAEIPVNLLVSPPLYRQRSKKPAWLEELQSLDVSIVPDLKPRQCNSVLLRLLASPNIASRECIYRQYDSQAMGNTVVPPGGDAAVLRIKGTKKGISLTVDGNGRYCYVDPFLGGVIAVAEAARNLVCSGAEPLAITDCLNFGNPEKADVYYQLKECIKGMARACRELRIPVISGNVSLYNESKGEAIYPTPIVGMLGIIEDINRHCTMSFKKGGDLVFLLGESSPLTSSSQLSSYNGLGASEYLELVHGLVRGKPNIDLDMEKRVQRCCLEAIKRGVIKSAHDCSEGGLLVAIAESCICGDIGFKGEGWKVKRRLDSAFFGEHQSRVVVSMSGDSAVKLSKVARKWQVPLTLLGRVGGKRLVVEGYIDLPLAKVGKAWRDGLKQLSGK
ncbi:MAG TPA: phosphoribosylformylglycinamidine synthase subunit PurL [Dehalococcoidia bacterium]|nr:phosphoribosylformylglycinamidine synthase subunit PurL [Dehalococcoidia bacterium]